MGSMGVFVFAERQEYRLEIKDQIPVLDVVKVMTDSFSQICVATKTVDLGPASDPGFHRVASVVMWDLVLKVPNQLRSFRTRPHQAHFAFKHVPELWHLIDIPLPYKCPDVKPARVILRRPANFPVFFRVQPHTANLQHVESLSIPAEPSLAI